MTINAYLNFNGNCREAFEFYRSVFGGDFNNLATFAEMPDDTPVGEDDRYKIMHMSLNVGSSVLMGSDVPEHFGPPRTFGDNVSLSFVAESRLEADTLFAAMSMGGKVEMPMQDMFWGDYFGACVDRFGINWQFLHSPAQ